LVERIPASDESVLKATVRVDLEQMSKLLLKWLAILKEYSETETIYDDPAVDKFQDDFFHEFVFDDDTTENQPYDELGQLSIRKYLATIKDLLPAYKDAADVQQLNEITSIESEIDMLATYVDILSKKEVAKKLAKIWAKGRKYSLSLIMEMLQEIKKEGFKTIAKTFIEGALMKGLQAWLP